MIRLISKSNNLTERLSWLDQTQYLPASYSTSKASTLSMSTVFNISSVKHVLDVRQIPAGSCHYLLHIKELQKLCDFSLVAIFSYTYI